MSDLRADLAKALGEAVTDEKLKEAILLALELKKGARGWCPNCRKAVQVEINDSKAVIGALGELMNQSYGRPGETASSDEEKIVFERVVYLGDEDPS